MMSEVCRLTLPQVPAECGSCGAQAGEWPLGVHAGRLVIVCPACHVAVAPVVAVAGDDGPPDSCEGEGP
jgi:hypothetical protein